MCANAGRDTKAETAKTVRITMQVNSVTITKYTTMRIFFRNTCGCVTVAPRLITACLEAYRIYRQ